VQAKEKKQRSEIGGVLSGQTGETWMAPLGNSHLGPKCEENQGIDQAHIFSSAAEV
jgi:hypothetical protein